MLMATAMLLAACTGKGPEHDHIRGEIVGLPDQVVRLRALDPDMRTVDTTLSVRGRFEFELPRVLPRMMFVQFDNFAGFFVPVITGGDVLITGKSDEPDRFVVGGTQACNDMERYRSSTREHEMAIRAINLGLSAITPDSSQYATLTARRDSLVGLCNGLRDEFIDRNPSSVMSAYLAWTKLSDTIFAAPHPRVYACELLDKLDSSMPANTFILRLQKAAK